jgi:hypothetical protein
MRNDDKILKKFSQTKISFRLGHGIQSKGSIWKRRGGQPAIGIKVLKASAF